VHLSTSWTPAPVDTLKRLSASRTPAPPSTTGPLQRLCVERPSDYSTHSSLSDFILIVLLVSTISITRAQTIADRLPGAAAEANANATVPRHNAAALLSQFQLRGNGIRALI
jgi:hypothetical protein